MSRTSSRDEWKNRLKDLLKDPVIEILPFVIAVVVDALKRQWSRLFASKSILILGAKASGKSSLLMFMRVGAPYEIIGGTRRTPDPTGAAVIVDKKIKLQDKNWVTLTRDVGGDPDIRQQWGELIKEVKPHGIIYMLDGYRARNGEALRRAVQEIFDDVLAHYASDLGALAALHVFLSFSDRWLTSPPDAYTRTAQVESMFNNTRAGNPVLETLRVQVSATQLSPNREEWKETERALFHFGADLMG